MRTSLVRKLSRIGIASTAAISLGLVGISPALASAEETAAEVALGEQSELKVLSYNILREGEFNTSASDLELRLNHPWKKVGVEARRYKVIKYIANSGASVVNLQEAEYLTQRDHLKNSVSLKEHWRMIEHNTDAARAWQQRPTIMYDTRKLENNPNDPTQAGVRKLGTNARNNPMFLQWARFLDKKSQTHFYVFNTHLPSNASSTADVMNVERDRQMAVVINRINEIVVDPNDPVILTGDFNSANSSAAILRAKSAGLRDAHDVPGIPISGKGLKTNPGFTVPTTKGNRLDRVFFKENSRLTITSYTTDVTEWLGSDHLPVYATFTLNPQ